MGDAGGGAKGDLSSALMRTDRHANDQTDQLTNDVTCEGCLIMNILPSRQSINIFIDP